MQQRERERGRTHKGAAGKFIFNKHEHHVIICGEVEVREGGAKRSHGDTSDRASRRACVICRLGGEGGRAHERSQGSRTSAVRV